MCAQIISYAKFHFCKNFYPAMQDIETESNNFRMAGRLQKILRKVNFKLKLKFSRQNVEKAEKPKVNPMLWRWGFISFS